jgi:hypothetical protein
MLSAVMVFAETGFFIFAISGILSAIEHVFISVCNLHSSPAPVVPQIIRLFEGQIKRWRLDAGRTYLENVTYTKS